MSRFVRHLLSTAVAGAMLAVSAGAQLLPSVSLPPVSLPAPMGNVPMVGPVVQDVLAQPQAQRAIQPTLNSVAGLPASIAEIGCPDLAGAQAPASAGAGAAKPRTVGSR